MKSSHHIHEFSPFRRFLYSQHAYTALRATLGLVLPGSVIILICGQVTMGFASALGAFCISLVDVPGPLRRKHQQMLSATLWLTVSALVTLFALHSSLAIWIIVGIISFCAGLATIYGSLSTAIGICALLGMDLILTQRSSTHDAQVYVFGLIAGGLWYCYFSLSVCFILRHQMARRALVDCLFTTADYFQVCKLCYQPDQPLEQVYPRMLTAQSAVIEAQQAARAVIFSYFVRRDALQDPMRLRFFNLLTDIIDIHGAVLATHADFTALRDHPTWRSTLEFLHDIVIKTAYQLNAVAQAIITQTPLAQHENINASLRALKHEVQLVQGQGQGQRHDDIVLLEAAVTRMQELVQTTGKLIQDLDSHTNTTGIDITALIERYYRPACQPSFWQRLRLSHSAPRYALRLMLAMWLGIAIGNCIGGHSTWIILTIMIVMRPSFATSRQRSKQRLLGTLLGCATVPVILWIAPQTYPLFIGLIIICYALCFALTPAKTYLISVFFTTVGVLLIYQLLVPGWAMVEQRALDTLIGTVIGALAVYLFPSWEYQRLGKDIETLQRTIQDYARAVLAQNFNISSSRITRREALYALAMLTMAYQRMMREPAKKRYQAPEINTWLLQCRLLLTELTAMAQQRTLHPELGKTASFQKTAHMVNATLMGTHLDEPPRVNTDPAFSTLDRITMAAWSVMQIGRQLTLPGMQQAQPLASHELSSG